MFKKITAAASAAVLAISAATSPAIAGQAPEVIEMKESIAPVAEAMEKAANTFVDVAPAAFAPMGDLFNGSPSMSFDWGRHDGITGFTRLQRRGRDQRAVSALNRVASAMRRGLRCDRDQAIECRWVWAIAALQKRHALRFILNRFNQH